MDEIKDLLGEEIKKEIGNLSSLGDATEKKSKAIDDIAKLYRLKLEQDKIEAEHEDSRNRPELEKEAKDDERVSREEQRKGVNLDRVINVGLQVLTVVGGWIAYDIWHRRGLKFEETGSVTSPFTRNLMTKMLPKK